MDTILVDKDARRISSTKDAKLIAKGKAAKDDPGFIQGYAAVWDVVDGQGDIVRKGAFAKSIQERVAAGKVKLMVKHIRDGGDAMEVIGTVTEMKEDDFGLWFHAVLASTDDAQQMRIKVVEGHVDRTSIGFLPIQWNFLALEDGTVVELTEAKALEVTLTIFPANEFAAITGAKAMVTAMKDKFPKLDANTPEEKGRVIQEVFGGRKEAEAFGKTLAGLAAQLVDLLAEKKPQQADAPLHSDIGREIDGLRLELDKLLLEE